MTLQKEMQSNYHVHLSPDERSFRIGLAEVWKYRDLVRLLTKKTFMLTYQQTILGPLWIIISPILSSLIYMFIFGHVASIGTGGIPQILFYFVSSAVWELFAFSLNANANTFVSNAYLFSKVYFPRLSVPISNMIVSILKFGIQFLIISALMIVFLIKGALSPMWAYFPLLPLLFIQMSLLGMSVGILVSSLTTKYRDLLMVVGLGVNLLMYASAIVYPMSSISDGYLKILLKVNPVTEIVELIRWIMLGSGEFDLVYYLAGLGLTLVLFTCSAAVFNRVERTFADRV